MQTWFLHALRRVLGRSRALAVYAAIYHWAGLVLVLVLLIGGAVAFFLFVRPWPDNHVGFATADVVDIVPRPSDSGSQKSILDLTLEDGQSVRVVVLNSRLVGVLNLVCLEKRERFKAKRPYFRFVHPGPCTAFSEER